MLTREYGQHSLISYVHQLRGERVNVGVLVWHPRLGVSFKTLNNLQRVEWLDFEADLGRIEQNLVQIGDAIETAKGNLESPLPALAAQFRFDLVVAPPMNARVTDVEFLAERLWDTLIAPNRPPRQRRQAIYERAFRNEFAGFVQRARNRLGLHDLKVNFTEEDSDQPLKIAARFRYQDDLHVWRVAAFSAADTERQQLTKAKAVTAENSLLKTMEV